MEDSRWAYPALLATFPVYYWAFALLGASLHALPAEILAGMAFIAIAHVAAWRKNRGTQVALAIGYLAHGVYDIFHDHWVSNAGVPSWWPEFCGSVDLLVGAYLMLLALRYRRVASA
ncbi:hypothetical protein N788_10100 [Arenimonas donghaensis DSM 18148 = HO3-R19]|uniref:Uncharacterized protein n=1 Tax=Arenimonas donghaensis DSM 18148 = HO3-R19 TaxID=1121014 RepID=A0A087MKD9_9GAMM|nr:hypothetical protein N788_10100 [Arenimonas donghaensis DSM 18148 = HO3-R19]